jgi:hypothetical protein
MITDRSSRRSNARAAVAAVLVAIACAPALAHRRDEYLQAARIAVDPLHIGIELDVTPGIAIAAATVAGLDRDGDGRISETEARAYAAWVQSGLTVEVDGQPLRLELVDVHAPAPAALTRGEGTIQITLAADVPSLVAGRQRLVYRNDHHPADAAYLANALSPSSPRVEIQVQRRDVDQRELAIEYTLDAKETAGVPWLVVGLVAEVAGFVGLGLWFRRWRREWP